MRTLTLTLTLTLTTTLTLMFAPRAHAEDWLAVLPACAIDDPSRPSLALVYPAPGLPAVVHAGDSLFLRARTPAALTPPPGVQQERVLAAYVAELRGAVLRAGVDSRDQHRHVLPVSSLRPDGPDSIVYRMRVDIPAYVAPGTYSLALRTPFGTRSAESAVRVLAPGAPLRIARLPRGVLLPPSAAGTLAVDLWVSGENAERASDEPEPSAEGDLPAPTLLAAGSSMALRIGNELAVRAGCENSVVFEREVSAVVAGQQLRRAVFDPNRFPSLAADLSLSAAIAQRSGEVELDNRSGATAREISVLLPFAASVRATGGQVAFYPTSEPVAREPRGKLARWQVPAGAHATLHIGTAPATQPELALRPSSARSGRPERVRVTGADARAKVAFSFGFAQNAYAPPDVRASFLGPLTQPVRAQIFGVDGAGHALQSHVWVEPHRPPNCAIASRGPRAPSFALSAVAGAVLALRLVRRRRIAKNASPGPALE